MTRIPPIGPNGTLTPEQFASFLNAQASYYPKPCPPESSFDPKPYTFTVPVRIRERVSIPPGALVRANPGLLRRVR